MTSIAIDFTDNHDAAKELLNKFVALQAGYKWDATHITDPLGNKAVRLEIWSLGEYIPRFVESLDAIISVVREKALTDSSFEVRFADNISYNHHDDRIEGCIEWILYELSALDWCVAFLRSIIDDDGNSKYKVKFQ